MMNICPCPWHAWHAKSRAIRCLHAQYFRDLYKRIKIMIVPTRLGPLLPAAASSAHAVASSSRAVRARVRRPSSVGCCWYCSTRPLLRSSSPTLRNAWTWLPCPRSSAAPSRLLPTPGGPNSRIAPNCSPGFSMAAGVAWFGDVD